MLELVRRGCSVRVIDQGEIPNQFSASHGKHRLLHPWKSDPSRGLDAHAALELWDKLLRELECDGFSRTGVIVANTDAESYEQSIRYPQFSALTGRVRFNHWTLFSTPDSFHIRDKAIIMTACSGIGYKFAPLTAQKVCTAVLDSKQRAHS
ncbi:FAD-dependent oxidoreductase [Bradyrhizobium sp. SSUT18]|uniref:FAD-dependent oxidoreductase n=1 Tax=Bradyrhizobium sp. SSUT18 TaxID=3040602 RepID=UPI0024495B40|nr:FAD-dependent oxidoreductase [Bradyrhizobium sp. SSUT18]MDH2400947.1 FAD-dependent oxidoreductase [Bradyrhizobium sp. SSUT18]